MDKKTKKVNLFFGVGKNEDQKPVSTVSYQKNNDQHTSTFLSSYTETQNFDDDKKNETIVLQFVFGVKSGVNVDKAVDEAKELIPFYKSKFPELLVVDLKVEGDYYGDRTVVFTLIISMQDFSQIPKLENKLGVINMKLNLNIFTEIPRGDDLYLISLTKEQQDNNFIKFDVQLEGEFDKQLSNDHFWPLFCKEFLKMNSDDPFLKLIHATNNVNFKVVTERPEEFYVNRIGSEFVSFIKGLGTYNKFRKYLASLLADILEFNEEPSYRESLEYYKENLKCYNLVKSNLTGLKKVNFIHQNMTHTLTLENFNILEEYFPTSEDLETYSGVLHQIPKGGYSYDGVRVLMIGLESVGKTSLLNAVTGQYFAVAPTKGVNLAQYNYGGYQLAIFDVGGSEKARGFWGSFLCPFIIYVMDGSASTAGMMMQKNVLVEFVNRNNLGKIPILVLINKEDLGGLPAADMMNIVSVNDRIPNGQNNLIHYQSCSINSGAHSGLDWLVNKISEAGVIPNANNNNNDNYY